MELYNDNCFNIFPEIQDNHVDLFILDLPYANKKFGNCTACKWDTPIDLKKMWEEIKRIMKPNATIVHFCNTKFGWTLIESNPKWFRYDLIWKKSKKVGFLSANKMPLRQHENIYVFSNNNITYSKNGKYGTYNPQKVQGEPYKVKEGKSKNVKGSLSRGHEVISKEYENKGDRHPTSIIEIEPDHENIYVFKDKQGTYNPQKSEGKPYICSRGGTGYYGELGEDYTTNALTENKGDRHPTSIIEPNIENTILEYKNPHKTIHRTQKPVDLVEWLIKSYSNEGHVVMDFCMGSGTTGVACKNLNRKFIGVEMDKEIYDKAYKRINEE
jgi:DNA modification methylase